MSNRVAKKIYIAMSGGVDSSVAAALLKKQGYKATGVFFKPWSPNLQGRTFKRSQDSTLGYCGWQQDRRDAMQVASVLGIPFKTWDFSKEYKKKVGDYMIESYRRGLTPNPDVMCNKEIKFGLFLKKALAEGADFIATGHYVRKESSIKNQALRYKILKAKDLNKDQSYFLWTLTQKELKYCLFPIGDYLKPEVRKMAKKFGLPTYNKKDSQGVCFIGQLDMKEFLKINIKSKSGEIRLLNSGPNSRSNLKGFQGSTLIGKHDGVQYYTIGQRHGLNIQIGGGPYFVAKKDVRKNIIYVVKDQSGLASDEFKVEKISWTNRPVELAKNLYVKIRYRTSSLPVASLKMSGSSLVLKLKKPARTVAAGQSAVFYRGQEMLGGGIIFISAPRSKYKVKLKMKNAKFRIA